MFQPSNGYILLQKVDRVDMLEGGFEFKVDEKEAKVLTGRVVAVDPYDTEGFKIDEELAYEEFDTSEIILGGQKMHLIQSNKVMGIFQKD